MERRMTMKHENILWRDRKRNFLGLPWTFTVYQFDEDRLFIDTGLFTSTEDDIRLYRITDITLRRTLWQKIIGTGTIHCDSADKTMREFEIKNVRDSFKAKEMLSKLVEKARLKNRVYAREDMHGAHGDADLDAYDQEMIDDPDIDYDVQ